MRQQFKNSLEFQLLTTFKIYFIELLKRVIGTVSIKSKFNLDALNQVSFDNITFPQISFEMWKCEMAAMLAIWILQKLLKSLQKLKREERTLYLVFCMLRHRYG